MRETLNLDYSLLIPEYILGGLALLIIVVDLFMPKVRKESLPYITAAGLVVAFASRSAGSTRTTTSPA